MFDSGGSSGQLRDELGVLPPGDVLKCALALARNEREARRVLLSRLPTLEHARLGGHTGGNLLLSMMEQLQRRLPRRGRRAARAARLRRPGLAGQRRAGEPVRGVRRRHAHARRGRGGRRPDGRHGVVRACGSSRRCRMHAGGRAGDRRVRGGDHRPGQLLHEPDADLPGARRRPKRSGRSRVRSSWSRTC